MLPLWNLLKSKSRSENATLCGGSVKHDVKQVVVWNGPHSIRLTSKATTECGSPLCEGWRRVKGGQDPQEGSGDNLRGQEGTDREKWKNTAAALALFIASSQAALLHTCNVFRWRTPPLTSPPQRTTQRFLWQKRKSRGWRIVNFSPDARWSERTTQWKTSEACWDHEHHT